MNEVVTYIAEGTLVEFEPYTDGEEIELGMSNCDHSIDEGFAEALRVAPRKAVGRHAGWNFNALVWFEHGQFHSEVWVHRSPRSRHQADTLKELMRIHNAEYGSD